MFRSGAYTSNLHVNVGSLNYNRWLFCEVAGIFASGVAGFQVLVTESITQDSSCPCRHEEFF